jgi:hypothetical protein
MATHFVTGLMLTCAMGLPAQLSAQKERIYGRVTLRPPIAENIDVILDLTARETGADIAQIIVDRESPHRFVGLIPSEVSGDVVITVSVLSPSNYVPWRLEYVKAACCEFNREIILKRPADVYVERLDRGQQADSFAQAVTEFTAASHVAETVGRKFEAQRALAAAYLGEGMYAEQQDALRDLLEHPDAASLGPQREQTYWNERFDGLLLWTDYTSLRLPERDFGRIIASGADTIITNAWKSFVADFLRAFPTVGVVDTSFDAATVSAQLRTVKTTLGRPQ